MKSAFFQYSEVSKFLEHCRNAYGVTSLREWKQGPGVILRHDVDFDVLAAHRFSFLEKKLNITSSYFFLLTSPCYNLFCETARKMLREMAENGFDIGLHFDPLAHGKESQDLEETVRNEALRLSSITGVEVRSISLHNPSIANRYPLFPGFRNAYDPALFSDANYLSDSCMDFRGKDPLAFVTKAASTPVQVVLHPAHYTEQGEGYPAIMSRYMVQMAETLDGLFGVNWKYREEMRGRRLRDVFMEECDGKRG